MAYNYLYPYQQYATNGYQVYNPYTPQMAQPQMAQPQVQQQPANGIIWVQGEQAARAYLVAPNTTVLLMDSEAQKFYIKSADASGMPQPLRTYEYHEVRPYKVDVSESSGMDKYVTRDELDRKLAELGGARNGEPSL